MAIKILVLFTLCSLAFSHFPTTCTTDSQCPSENLCDPVYKTCVHTWAINFSWVKFTGFLLVCVFYMLSNTIGFQAGFLCTPMYILCFNFSILESISINKPINLIGNFVYLGLHFSEKLPNTQVLALDYNFCLIFMPVFFVGSQFGVFMNLVMPKWLLLVIAIIVIVYFGYKLYLRLQDTQEKEIFQDNYNSIVNNLEAKEAKAKEDEQIIQATDEPSINAEQAASLEEKNLEINQILHGFQWHKFLYFFFITSIFFVLEFLKGTKSHHSLIGVTFCSPEFWILFFTPCALATALSFVGFYWVKLEQDHLEELGYDRPKEHHKWNGIECLYKVAFILFCSFITVAVGLGSGLIINIMLQEIGLSVLGSANTNNLIQIFMQLIQILLFMNENKLALSWAGIFMICSIFGAVTGSYLKAFLVKINRISYILMIFLGLLVFAFCSFFYITYKSMSSEIKNNVNVFAFTPYC